MAEVDEYKLRFVYTDDADGKQKVINLDAASHYDYPTLTSWKREIAIPRSELQRVQRRDVLAVVYQTYDPQQPSVPSPRRFRIPDDTEWKPVQAAPYGMQDVFKGGLVVPTEQHKLTYVGLEHWGQARRSLLIKAQVLETLNDTLRNGTQRNGVEVVLIETTTNASPASRNQPPTVTERRGLLQAYRTPVSGQ